MKRSARYPVIAFAAALAAALACNFPGQGPNANATVAALSTAIRQTVVVQTQSAALFTSVPPTEIPPTAASAPTDQPTAVPPTPNDSALHARRLAVPVTIDGDLSEWGRLPYTVSQAVYRPESWLGPSDQSLEYALGWDATYLYVVALITDDVHVQTQHAEAIYKGDSVEVLLDADLAGDSAVQKLDGDDYQLGLSPGTLSGDSPEAYLWFPSARAGTPAGVVLAVRPVAAGFSLEAAIPWSLFLRSPAAGQQFGFALSASDNDSPGTAEQQSMISSAPARKLVDPTTWGLLTLDN